MTPKLIGYICQNGAYVFYENGHALLRTLPHGFQALPVAHISQVGIAEIVKAFRLGAKAVLMLGCETCRSAPSRTLLEQQHAALLRELEQWGITSERLVLAWCAAGEAENFFATVTATMTTVEHLPPLVLSRAVDTTIQHCG